MNKAKKKYKTKRKVQQKKFSFFSQDKNNKTFSKTKKEDEKGIRSY